MRLRLRQAKILLFQFLLASFILLYIGCGAKAPTPKQEIAEQPPLYILRYLDWSGKAPKPKQEVEEVVEQPRYLLSPLEPADPPVEATNGMVVAAHPLAAEAGLRVLQEGGNAVDAALAALFMLNVVEPHASGLGGGGFALVRMAGGESKVVVYRESAPLNIDPGFYYDPADSNQSRMAHGGSSICVPGAAAGWNALFENWATLPLERLSRDAIGAAEDGFPVDSTLDTRMKAAIETILADEQLADVFTNDGLYYEFGDTLRQPELAASLKYLTEHGLLSFYQGSIAEAVINASQAGGGFIDQNDLSTFKAEIVDPVQSDLKGLFAGYSALTVPPPSRGGVTVLEALNLFEITGVYNYPPHSPEAVHLMSICLQQAYIDAAIAVGDPHFKTRDWAELVTIDFAQQAAQKLFLDVRPKDRPPTIPPDTTDPGNTTHLVVVDKWGNAVSLTQSINHFFGAGVMAPGTGILMNDQMLDFSVLPQAGQGPSLSVNLIEGGKRPRSNMAPLILTRDDKVYLVVGTPGGPRIPAAVAQIVVNLIAYQMDISAAIDYPRWIGIREHLVLENRFTEEDLDALKGRGHVLHPLPNPYEVYFGGAHGISIDPQSGLITGAADKRRGGAAVGF